MFKSDRLVYLQLQKTGSTHITSLLSEILDGNQYTKHMRPPAPIHNEDKYIIGSIRNPWDWYVSLWSFGCQNNGGFYKRLTSRILTGLYIPRYPLKSIVSFINELTKPIEKWQYLYSDWKDPELFRNWLRLIFEQKRKYDLKEKYGFSPISEYGGFLTYRYMYLYSKDLKKIYSNKYIGNPAQLKEFDKTNNMLDFIIQNENLEKDLIDVLQKMNIPLKNKDIQKINSSKKTNTSKRSKNLQQYYDKDSSELIKNREKFLIEKYDYQAPEL